MALARRRLACQLALSFLIAASGTAVHHGALLLLLAIKGLFQSCICTIRWWKHFEGLALVLKTHQFELTLPPLDLRINLLKHFIFVLWNLHLLII